MKVFAYMINPNTVFVLTESGKLVERKEVENGVAGAKEYLLSAGFHQTCLHATEGSDYDLGWIDEPGMNEAVIAASDLYENIKRGEIQEAAQGEQVEIVSESAVISEKQFDSIEAEEVKPVVPEVPYSELIEVDAEITHSEMVLKGMVLDLEQMKMELAGIQADFNKKIKDAMKQIFDYAKGNSKTHVKCRIEYDWQSDTRYWYREDTGALVKSEEIPSHLRQTELKLEPENTETIQPESEVLSNKETEVINIQSEYPDGFEIEENEQISESDVIEESDVAA